MAILLCLSSLVVLIIALLLIYEYVYKFYLKVKKYPTGPYPLPLLGNSLLLIAYINRHPSDLFRKLAQTYDDIFTFWFTTHPIVVISGIKVAKGAFNNYDICDRSKPSLEKSINDLFIAGRKLFSDMNVCEEFKLYKSLTVQSLRKYLSNNKLSILVPNVVKDTVNIIMTNERNNDFVPFKYIKSIFIRIIYESIFDKKIAFDDKFIENMSLYLDSFDKNIVRLFVSDHIPILKFFMDLAKDKPFNDSVNKTITDLFNDINKQKTDNFNSIAESIVSVSKNMRKQENTDLSECLNDSNLSALLMVLFFGGSDSSHNTFRWILLLMAYYPEMQQKMRKEIDYKIGNKTLDISDKENCVYVNAFICETLRYRNVGPFSFAHMTSCDTKISDISIPKSTTVILNQLSILNDSRYWNNPDVFYPERFINTENTLIASEFLSFIPFSTGKRMCPGDKFTMNVMFLALTSLLQATSGSKFVLSNNQCIDLEPTNLSIILETKLYKVCISKDE